VKQSLGDNKFKGDRKVVSFMAGWLIKEDRGFCQQETEKLVSHSCGGDFAETK